MPFFFSSSFVKYPTSSPQESKLLLVIMIPIVTHGVTQQGRQTRRQQVFCKLEISKLGLEISDTAAVGVVVVTRHGENNF